MNVKARILHTILVSLVVLGLALAVTPHALAQAPLVFDVPVYGVDAIDCGDFTAQAVTDGSVHVILFFDDYGDLSKALVHININVYATNPDTGETLTIYSRNVTISDYENFTVSDRGATFRLADPDGGIVSIDAGYFTINLATGEVTMYGPHPFITTGGDEAICAALS